MRKHLFLSHRLKALLSLQCKKKMKEGKKSRLRYKSWKLHKKCFQALLVYILRKMFEFLNVINFIVSTYDERYGRRKNEITIIRLLLDYLFNAKQILFVFPFSRRLFYCHRRHKKKNIKTILSRKKKKIHSEMRNRHQNWLFDENGMKKWFSTTSIRRLPIVNWMR